MILLTDTAAGMRKFFPGSKLLEIRSFPDGEIYVRIPVSVKGQDVLLIHKAFPDINSNLIKLFIALGGLRQQGAKKIRLFIPYLPYARMDKSVKSGECISINTICSLLKSLGVTELITFDAHMLKQQGNFTWKGLKIKNLSAAKLLKSHFSYDIALSPDQGASYMSGRGMQKVRANYGKGKNAYRKIAGLALNINVKGKNILLIDDMISTGSTMIRAIQVLRKAGAKKIYVAATHGLFLNDSLRKISNLADGIVTTYSITNPTSKIHLAKLIK